MAFRGREWHPPEREQVEQQIKSRVQIHSMDLDALKQLFASSGSEMTLELEYEDPQFEPANLLEEANIAFYDGLSKIEKTIGPSDTVNIVIPVFNSLHLVRECIDSVLKNTHWPYFLTVVDDASDAHTHAELEKIVAEISVKNPNHTLITNRKNKGFAASVNRGIKAGESKSRYTCLLNSDVLTTPKWLTKMVMAMKADKRNKIVNPVTNNTALINVPMSEGFSYQAMNASLEHQAQRRYPEIMPTGFCFLVDNEMFRVVGYMDEAYANFGEESDWWMRVITWTDGITFQRWRAVLADDTYVFHQRSASFATLGEEITKQLRNTASMRFRSSWPTYGLFSKAINHQRSVGPIKRNRGPREFDSAYAHKKPSICYVVHSPEVCGAMHYIADIINAINTNGGDARLAVIRRPERPSVEPVAELRCSPVIFESTDEFVAEFASRVFKNGLVIAATSELSPAVAELAKANVGLTPILHVQSYEPSLAPPEALEAVKANFDLIPNIISSSNWITNVMKKPVLATINPGVDRDIFYPGNRLQGDERLTVTMVLNGAYPFKGAERGVQVAKYIVQYAKKAGKDIRVLAYGIDAISGVPEIVCQGHPSRTRIQKILANETDVFLDPAVCHSYGMPALEAIACGVPVVGWDNQGIREYLPKGYDGNSIFKNTTPPKDVAIRVMELLLDDSVRKAVAEKQHSMAMIGAHDRKKSVAKFMDCIQENYGALTPKNIVVITPHLRKHGGPTTILTMANELANRGHNVTIGTVYHDINPEVVRYTDLPIVLLRQDAGNIPPCDLVITNSDNPLNADIEKLPCKKIMLKLSHNARFKQLEEMGLNCKWDAIVTSSQWLADVCENVTLGWNYSPVKATRVGWYHYNFPLMRRNHKRKRFNVKDGDTPVVITTLIHQHPSKGSKEAGAVFAALRARYGSKIHLIGVGEVPQEDLRIEIPGMQYVFSPSRDEMADLMFKTDIWLGCSHTEGLGRMTLEAMTGLAACVLTDTGAEFVENGKNALVAPVGDASQLMALVQDLIDNPEGRRQIAIAGFETAKKVGDPTQFLDNLEKVIFDVF